MKAIKIKNLRRGSKIKKLMFLTFIALTMLLFTVPSYATTLNPWDPGCGTVSLASYPEHIEDTQVPEPSTFLLLGAGLLVAALFVRKQ